MHSGIILLDHTRNENVLEELQVDPVENKLAQRIQNCYTGLKSLDARNDSLTIDLSEDKDLDDRRRDR
jgi:hypothetical protein